MWIALPHTKLQRWCLPRLQRPTWQVQSMVQFHAWSIHRRNTWQPTSLGVDMAISYTSWEPQVKRGVNDWDENLVRHNLGIAQALHVATHALGNMQMGKLLGNQITAGESPTLGLGASMGMLLGLRSMSSERTTDTY